MLSPRRGGEKSSARGILSRISDRARLVAFESSRLYFIQRGDPNTGLYVILLLLLAGQLLNRHSLPPTEQIITVLLCFIVATTIHEFMHAYTAWRLGDDTAKSLGRISLNPAVHFEPFGFFGMVMISLGYSFIGWGKPVPVNPNRFRAANFVNRKQGMALVAIAGPISNIVQAAVAAVSLRLAGYGEDDFNFLRSTNVNGGTISYVLAWYFWVNVLLASFNLIPIPPLDGHKVLVGILPNFWYPVLAPLERYGFVILFLIFFLSGRIGSSITNEMFSPVQLFLFRHLL